MEYPRPSKRPRNDSSKKHRFAPSPECTSSTGDPPELKQQLPSLNDLISRGCWDEAMFRLESHPHDAATENRPSPLAVACRHGAPAKLIKSLLLAAPHRLRDLLDSRGTPLHEAIGCEATSMETLRALLQTDELLDRFGSTRTMEDLEITPPTRATLLQDVDGFTPLHLLIRRRFQWHVLESNDASGNDGTTSTTNNLMTKMLEALVSSCPESVLVPDRGEYEEPPIVYALKANIYAPGVADGEAHFVKVESRIYEMVDIMLSYAPFAATQTFSGAVFHGRYTNTIALLLQTEAAVASPQQPPAALLKNTQAELPLHFCTMRGERPRTVALLAKHAPQAVLQRDSSGLTPFHWLWIRYMSTLMSLEEDERSEERFDIPIGSRAHHELDSYNEFSMLEQTDFESDLRWIRRLDPPVDFLRMRHIPEDVAKNPDMHEWVNDIKDILNQVRTRYHEQIDTTFHNWTRTQAVTALFWTKVVSMLRATKSELRPLLVHDSGLVHAAFASQCCPPPIARLVALLFPHELVTADSSKRLPIHYAAERKFHAWDWLREDGPQITAAGDLLRNESLQALRDAIELSPREAMRVADTSNRLVVHHVIATFVHACCQPARSSSNGEVEEIIRILRELVSLYPECLSRRDGVSKLHPFLQSVACATEQDDQMFVDEKNSLNITYVLLRENPAVLVSMLRS